MPRKLIAEEGVHGFDRRALPIMSEPKALVDGTEGKTKHSIYKECGQSESTHASYRGKRTAAIAPREEVVRGRSGESGPNRVEACDRTS
jgi:hypothetical protein